MDRRLYQCVERVVAGLGYEFVHVEWVPRSGLMRVYIDRDGGIGVEDCARVSDQLSRSLPVEGFGYERLEVSSPGLDRPLAKEADFIRFDGHKVRLVLRVPLNGRKNFTGTIGQVVDGVVRLATEGGKSVEIEFSNIDKARLVPEL